MTKGTRARDDEFNTHETGYHEGDQVEVLDEGAWVKGVVRAIQAKGPKIDVHIGHSGHKNNGRVVVVGLDDVRPIEESSVGWRGRKSKDASAEV